MATEDDPIEESAAEIRAQFARKDAEIERLRAGIRKHRDQRGDDRCWLDDLELYAILGDGQEPSLSLPPKAEFLESCERYWNGRQSHAGSYAGCMTIRQLEDEVARLKAEVARLRGELNAWPTGPIN